MFNDLMNALYIILYILPFSVLRYYPFLDKLRIPLKSLCFLYGTIMLIQVISYIYLCKCDFWNIQLTQTFRISFGAIYALISFVVIKEQFFKHFFVYIMMFTYSSFVCTNAHRLDAFISHYYTGVSNYLIINLAILLQLFLSYPFVFKFIKTKINPLLQIKNTDVWNYIWIIPLMFIIVGISFGTDLSENVLIDWRHFTIRCIVSSGLITSCFILVKILEQTNRNATLNENLRMSDNMLKVQANHYKILTDNINKAKAIRHDMHHHFIVLQNYLQNNQLTLLEKYLAKYNAVFAVNHSPPLCNNHVIDAILQHYSAMAESLTVTFKAKIDIPAKLPMSDLDLCIILGNTLENAIEACSRMTSTERFIYLNIKVIGNMLVIAIDNSYNEILKTTAHSFVSQKREGNTEGVGIASIKSIANKYNGAVEFDFTANIFKTSIMLNLINIQ